MNELDDPRGALDAVARRLDAELAGSLERTYVDVGSLRSGAVRRAGRVRAVRRGVAAFVLVGVVLGVSVSSVLPRDSDRELADGTGHGQHVAGVPTSTADPDSFAVEAQDPNAPPRWVTPRIRRGALILTPSPINRNDARSVAFVIPDSVAVDTAALFPTGRREVGEDSGQFWYQTPLQGLDCEDFGKGGPYGIAGRSWSWFDSRDDVHGLSVYETVSAWDLGTGVDRLLDLAHNRGACTFAAGQRPTTVSRADDWDRWEAVSAPTPPRPDWTGTLGGAYVVRRQEDVIVAITVSHPGGTAKALALARSLCDQAVARLEAAGIG